jgi:hypothetical protein
VIDEWDLNSIGGSNQSARDVVVLLAGVVASGGVVVRKDEAHGAMLYEFVENGANVNECFVGCALADEHVCL